MASGWLLAGDSETLAGPVVDLEIGTQSVLLVRDGSGTRAFDGVCPHRGGRLGRGGTRAGDHIICPFHGNHIRLGQGDDALCVAELPAIEIAELVFVHLGDGVPDCGFASAISALKASHVFVHGFSMVLPVPPRLVIENAFDTAHFGPVHGVPLASALTMEPFKPDGRAPLAGRGRFLVAASPWDLEPDGTPIQIDYEARAYGPGLIVSTQRGSRPYSFLVGATPDGQGGTIARVILMLPREEDVPMERAEWLLGAMEKQLAADSEIWAGLPAEPARRLQPGEESIAAFWAFCDHFPDAAG